MIRKILSEFADEAAFLVTAFFVRNSILLVTLATVLVVTLARP